MTFLLISLLLLSTAGYSRPKVVAQDKEHLLRLIQQEISSTPAGKVVDLNFIDVSKITDMQCLFEYEYDDDIDDEIDLRNREIDISEWDVSNVKDMLGMFYGSSFNGDISKWNVSSVTDMSGMFWGASFNGDISKWNVSNVTDMNEMFSKSRFKGVISEWCAKNPQEACDPSHLGL